MTGISALAAIPSESGIKDKFSAQEMPSIFCSLFPRRDILICKLPNQDRWRKWTGPLEDHQILGVIADGGRGILRGCYWDEQTHHAVLDIDKDSKYHSAQELAKLQGNLAAVGLTVTPYRSSESGGWHLYIFFDDWAECSEVENTIKAWLKLQGYEIKSGTLEIFPSGNALRLPLQPGFAWLDQQGSLIRTREEITRDEALAAFLFDLERYQRNWSEAKHRIESQLRAAAAAAGGSAQAHDKAISNEGFDDLFKRGAIPEICELARKYWREGLTGPKQRHEALYSLQHLLWFGDASLGIPKLPGTRNDERRHQFLMNWLERNHNGYCDHINRGQWREIEEATRRKCDWRGNHPAPVKRVPYMVTETLAEVLEGQTKKTGHLFTPADAERANIKREEWAREKIRAAVQLLAGQGNEPRLRLLMRLTGCHPRTLRRHSDIWKISPLPSVAGHLDPGGSGGGLAVLSEICPDRFEEKKEKEFLDPSCSGDSGDLELDRDLPTQERGAPSEDLEQAASLGSAVAPPIPPQAAATFRFGATSAEQPCELAPIFLGCLLPRAVRQVAKARESDGKETAGSLASPPHTQPSTGSKHWLLWVSGTCGLNGFLPSSAEPLLGPPHLNPREIFSKGSGLVMLQEGGSSRAEAHSGVYGPLVQPYGIFRYEGLDFHSGVQVSSNDAFQSRRYENDQRPTQCIRANSPRRCRLWILVYSDVRGPPIGKFACNACLKNNGTICGA